VLAIVPAVKVQPTSDARGSMAPAAAGRAALWRNLAPDPGAYRGVHMSIRTKWQTRSTKVKGENIVVHPRLVAASHNNHSLAHHGGSMA
jgi:hypothetical protein